MGVMEAPVERGQLVITPHPVTRDGQRHLPCDVRPGESLALFLERHIGMSAAEQWEVAIGGVVVPCEHWLRVYPKHGQVIEVRGKVGRSALYLVAFAALTYFTMGAGATWAAGLGAVGSTVAYGAAFVGGSILINKVLGPRVPSAAGQDVSPVHRISAARNQMRLFQPPGLLLGSVRIAPDVLSKSYTWYEGDDQYVGMILTPGINVDSIEELYFGDAPLSSFEGVEVWHSGFSGMPEQPIPLHANADTIAGGSLEAEGPWVTRVGSAGAIGLQLDIEGRLYDMNDRGVQPNWVHLHIEYRLVGAAAWTAYPVQTLRSSSTKEIRRTYAITVPAGQYEVRVRLDRPRWNEGEGRDEVALHWTWLRSIRPDTGNYGGLPRIGIKIKATGQLNGTPDELRCVAHARPIPVWTGTEWITQRTSNPGALILAYARGFFEGGVRVAGMGLPDDEIDIESLQAFMAHCAAQGYTYDWCVTDTRDHGEMLEALARAGLGQVGWPGGRLTAIWAADDQPLSGVVNMATISEGTFQVGYSLDGAADGVEVTYYDATDWSPKTLRIPAPGVTTMLKPARLQLEGVVHEEAAAVAGRFHLAQSLYQYKEIGFGTDLEHLSYHRMSLLSLQHDLTQWGYGGTVLGTSIVGGVVSLHLDAPVPAPASGGAFIGLRIPGERVCRIFPVQSFEGERDTLTLVGPWPDDAALPGDGEGNPADDTIWMYDFKSTPGQRVRVVQIEPESGAAGARVSVVPEGPEYWHYVHTGEYIPAPSGSRLQTRPVASNLRVTEQQVVQGDTTYTELSVAFEVSGPVGHTVVLAADEDGVLEEVAQTVTRSATWRIPRAGVYTIVVRPYSPEGTAGVAASVVYATLGADAPPVLVDLFDVEQRSGGVRLYTWGWFEDTIRSADFAGVEIRYTAGTIAQPDWDSMTPVGETGYFTAPFEAVIPDAGTWTFACRSRNTSGRLSTGMRVVTRTLQANVGQIIDEITQRQIDERQRLDAEIQERAREDIRVSEEAAADALAKAHAARDEAIARVDALAADVAEIVNAPEWSATEDYIAGWLVRETGKLYRAEVANRNQRPSQNPATWTLLGEYSSVSDALAAALEMATTTANDLAAEAQRVSALYARMPTGTGRLSTEAQVIEERNVRAQEDSALSERLTSVQIRLPAGNGMLASNARVDQVDQARRDGDTTLAQRIGLAETEIAGKASAGALSQLSGQVQQIDGRVTANASALLAVNAKVDAPFAASRTWEFVNANPGYNGFTAGNASLASFVAPSNYGATALTSTTNDPVFTSPAGLVIDGKSNPIVRALVRRRTASSAWDGRLFWATAGHGFTSTHSSFNATPVPPTGGGTDNWAIVEWDLSQNSDWNTSTITQLRFDFEGGTAPATTDIRWIAVGNKSGNPTSGSVAQELRAGIDAQGSAFAQAIIGVKAEQTGSGNLLAGGDFGGSVSSVLVLGSNQWTGAIGQKNLAGASWQAQGTDNYGVTVPSGTPSGLIQHRFSTQAAVAAGETLMASAYLANHRCTGFVRIGFVNASGTLLGSWINSPANSTAQGGSALSGWARVSTPAAVAPAGTTRVLMDWIVQDATGATPYGWITLPMLEKGREGQTKPSPWTPGAGGLSSAVLNLQVDTAAMITLTTNVNGQVSGMVSKNDGQRSSITFLSRVVNFISDRVGIGIEMSGEEAWMRFYLSSVQLVLGCGFGQGGQFILWFGPNIGVAACDRARGTLQLRNDGSSYFGGSLSAGVRRQAAQSTQISATAQVETGPFGTAGAPKNVVWSLSYNNSGYHGSNMPTADITATVVLDRSYAGGAWQQVGSMNIVGTRRNLGAEPGLGYSYAFNLGGSSTFTDTLQGTGDFNYRARVTAANGWPFTLQTGGGAGTQSLAILSIEE